ncbi:DUF4926 domain-containing protein [Clostridium saccharoperbutylacetonicum]|uniref:DUF4926 domain-containing protein n=1 Tax=Clostridium saccharoperbutylacetonicum TaxID=36745 RepID=UPI0039EA7CF3
MFKEYDVVYANEDINELIKKNTLGVVLMTFEGEPSYYEVEFVDENKSTINVLTVSQDKLRY